MSPTKKQAEGMSTEQLYPSIMLTQALLLLPHRPSCIPLWWATTTGRKNTHISGGSVAVAQFPSIPKHTRQPRAPGFTLRRYTALISLLEIISHLDTLFPLLAHLPQVVRDFVLWMSPVCNTKSEESWAMHYAHFLFLSVLGGVYYGV